MKFFKVKSLLLSSLLMLFAVNNATAQKAIVTPVKYARITLISSPAGAKVYHNGRLICTSTPATIEIPFKGIIQPGKKKDLESRLRRSSEASSIHLTFMMDGYITSEEVIYPTIREEKKDYSFEWPAQVIHEMQPTQATVAQKAAQAAVEARENERVTRETSGDTDLERTIIRWYFDSAPQGARIFWRVISSVPDQVKNTNELWLGNTPYEETRSFNIIGLTQKNARDVQVEIKVKRKGYIDQTKRFNVRQAIDQQEISSFFDMIKEETEPAE